MGQVSVQSLLILWVNFVLQNFTPWNPKPVASQSVTLFEQKVVADVNSKAGALLSRVSPGPIELVPHEKGEPGCRACH